MPDTSPLISSQLSLMLFVISSMIVTVQLSVVSGLTHLLLPGANRVGHDRIRKDASPDARRHAARAHCRQRQGYLPLVLFSATPDTFCTETLIAVHIQRVKSHSVSAMVCDSWNSGRGFESPTGSVHICQKMLTVS